MWRYFSLIGAMIIAIVPSISAKKLTTEIGALALKCWTKDQELKHPYGVGIYFMQSVSAKVKLAVDCSYYTNARKYYGTLRRFGPPYPYPPDEVGDQIHEENRLWAIGIGMLHTICHSRITFLEAGGGFCVASLARDVKGIKSGIRYDSHFAGRIGLTINISLLVTELKNLPLIMRCGFSHKFLSGPMESTYDGYTAFSDPITTTEVSFGFGYQFGKHSHRQLYPPDWQPDE